MSKALSQVYFVEQVLPAKARDRGLTLAVQESAQLKDMELALVELDVYRQGGQTQRGLRRARWVREGKGSIYSTLGNFKVSASGGQFTKVEPIQPKKSESWRHAFRPGVFHGQWSAAYLQHREGAEEVSGRRTFGDKQVKLTGTVRRDDAGKIAGLDLSFEEAKGRKGEAWLELSDRETLSGFWWYAGKTPQETQANRKAARTQAGHLVYWKRDDVSHPDRPILDDPSAKDSPQVPQDVQAPEGLTIPLRFRGIAERYSLFVPMEELRQEFVDALGKGLAKRTERAVFLEIGLRLNTLGGNKADEKVSYDYFAEVEIPYDRGLQAELARKSIYARGYLEGSWLVFSDHKPHPATCIRKKTLPQFAKRKLHDDACVKATEWDAEYQRLARLTGVPPKEDWRAAESFAEPYGKGVIQGWRDRDALWESVYFRYSLGGFNRFASENPFPQGRPEWFEHELYCAFRLDRSSAIGAAYERGEMARGLLAAGFNGAYVTKAETKAQDALEAEQRKAWGDAFEPHGARVAIGSQGLAIRVPRELFEEGAEAFQAAEDRRRRGELEEGQRTPWYVEIKTLIQDANQDVRTVKTYAAQGYDEYNAPWDRHGPEWWEQYQFCQLLRNGRGDKGLLKKTYANDPAFTSGYEHAYKPDLADPVDDATRATPSFQAGLAQGKLLLEAKQQGTAAHAIHVHGRKVGRGEAKRQDAFVTSQASKAGLSAKAAERFYQAGYDQGHHETAGARDAAVFVRVGYLLGIRDRDARLVKTYAGFGYGPTTQNPYRRGRRKREFTRFQHLLAHGTPSSKKPGKEFLAGFQDGFAGKPAPQANPAQKLKEKKPDPRQEGWEQGQRLSAAFDQGRAAYAIHRHGQQVGKGKASKQPDLIRKQADEAKISAGESEAYYENGLRQGKDEAAREKLKAWLEKNQGAFRKAIFESVEHYLEHPEKWKPDEFFGKTFPWGMYDVHTDATEKNGVDEALFALQARHALRQAFLVMSARKAEGLALKVDEFILPKLEWLGAWFGFWQTEYFIETCRRNPVTLFSSGKVRRAGAFDFLDDPDCTLLEATGYAFLGLFDAALTVGIVWQAGAAVWRAGSLVWQGQMGVSAVFATFLTGAARWKARNVLVAVGGNLALSGILGVVGEGLASSIEERDFNTSLALSRILSNALTFLLLGGAMNLAGAKLVQRAAPKLVEGKMLGMRVRLPLSQQTRGLLAKGWTETEISRKELLTHLTYAHMAVGGMRASWDLIHADDEQERKAALAGLLEMVLMFVLFEGIRAILEMSANQGVLQKRRLETPAELRARAQQMGRAAELELYQLPNGEIYQRIGQHHTPYGGRGGTLGIEIEGQFPGTRTTARVAVAGYIRQALQGQPGCEVLRIRQDRHAWTVEYGPNAQNLRTIRITGDASIVTRPGYVDVEIAFAPHTLGELPLTQRVFRHLQQNRFEVAGRAAIHIHVGLPNLRVAETMLIAKLFGDLEAQILNHFQVWAGRRAYNQNTLAAEASNYQHNWYLEGTAPTGIPYPIRGTDGGYSLGIGDGATRLTAAQRVHHLSMRLGRTQPRMLALRRFTTPTGEVNYTYEFRVFNASLSPAMLRSYMDFCRKFVHGIRSNQPDLMQYLQSTPNPNLQRVMHLLNIHARPAIPTPDPLGGH